MRPITADTISAKGGGVVEVSGQRVTLFPLAHHCYRLGWRNLTEPRLSERPELTPAGETHDSS